MTHPALGRAVPVHFMMADLAGWGANAPEAGWRSHDADYGPLRDPAEAAKAICFGRASLVRMALVDHGFDLMAWREFLLAAPDPDRGRSEDGFGYGHPYAAGIVDRIVTEAAMRPDRAALEAAATAIWPQEVARAVAFYDKHWKDNPEPDWLAAIQDWPFVTS